MAGQIIIDAADNQLAAPVLAQGHQLVTGQPAGAQDAFVKLIFRVVFQCLGDKTDPLVGHAIARGGIQVDADDAGGFHVPAGFFQGFAHGGFGQGFIRVQMAGGLVEHGAAALEFFDHQEAAVVFDDGGDGDVRLPGHGKSLGMPRGLRAGLRAMWELACLR